MAEVARGLEVSPNVLHRWRRGVPRWHRQRVSGQRQTALVGRQGGGIGTKDRSAGPGDRFFKGVLAAHRGTADAAGVDWQSAVFRKVEEEVNAATGLSVKRMVELAQVSRASFYRFGKTRLKLGQIQIWICGTLSSGSHWNGQVMDGGESRLNCGGVAGRRITSESSA